ncbi:hypothetical protein DLM78_22985 [Leptospira stimsonii]|uniref:Uncharacterized protein n=2 Tax=Leptospira stimsonii TaxID=2202203 RepID=A0A8B3CLN7_9LEPT|nr:hypothetical protein DLM78_22985 [Leptospira stimsonii]
MNGGIILTLTFAIIFIYILPLMGIFYAYWSSIGVLISILLWAMAILHFDAFETRSFIMRNPYVARRQIPILSRYTFKPILALHRLLDPLDYRIKLRNSRVEIVRYLLHYHLILMKDSNLNHSTQVRKLTSIFERFMK